MSTPERTVPHADAWPIENRRQMMRDVVTSLAKEDCLRVGFAPAIARTYGVLPCEVEAEMMRHLSESEGK